MLKTRSLNTKTSLFTVGLVITAAALTNCSNNSGTGGNASGSVTEVRLAYFPNMTHAPALIGVAKGHFDKALGSQGKIKTFVVNAGPEAMQALLAGELDIAFVGPSPAINLYIKSDGEALRMVAGACSGGAGLVARGDVPISGIKDLSGKKVAIPQLGNTQDVSLRHFMSKEGLKPKEKGGTVEVLPVKNPDVLALFVKKELDAAWVPEPWMTRLSKETGAKIVIDERDLWPNRQFTTTVVVVRTKFLQEYPALVEAILKAHLETLQWMQQNKAEAMKVANEEIKRLTGKPLPKDVLSESWDRVEFTADPNQPSIEEFVRAAVDAGYIKPEQSDVAAMFDTTPLENARKKVAKTTQ